MICIRQNGNKLDNRIENLILMTMSEHIKHHRKYINTFKKNNKMKDDIYVTQRTFLFQNIQEATRKQVTVEALWEKLNGTKIEPRECRYMNKLCYDLNTRQLFIELRKLGMEI